MNDRGKLLTDLEKVKNFLLHASTTLDVPNKLSKSVNGAWAEILHQLMAAHLASSANEDQLLRTDWLTHYNPQSRQWAGSRSVKDQFDLREYRGRHKELLGDLLRYTKGLRESCISFCDAREPDRPDAFGSFMADPKARTEVIEWSKKLSRIGVLASFLPILLAVRERWPDNPYKYLEVIKLCERFAFRVYRLGGYRANAGQSMLFHLGFDLAKKECLFDEAIRRIKRELAYWCDDNYFRDLTIAESPDKK